jgi:hypothetical protein
MSQNRGDGESTRTLADPRGESKVAKASDYAVVSDVVTALEIGGDVDQTFTFAVPATSSLARKPW